jgi:uncharacterized paraquat-inducible protein A
MTKTKLYIFASFFMTFAVYISFVMGIDNPLMGLGIFAAFSTVLAFSMRKGLYMLDRNFVWFSKTYPECVTADSVSCNACKSEQVHARGMTNNTKMREHFCTRCGHVLYYSPEG